MLMAGLAGGMVLTGLILLVRELTRRAPPPGTPPPLRITMPPATRNRALVAVGVGLLVLAITRWPVAMVAAAAAVLFLPRIASTKAARQRAAVLEGLEQWTRRLSDMLTASRGLEDALEASVASAPAAIEPAVARLGRRLAARTGTEAALRAFAAEINDPAGDRIAAALIIATGRRGGGVRDVLNSLAVMLARDVAARREIEADRAQHRTTVKWLTFFVAGFTAFAVLNRSYSAPYGTVAGQLVMALVAALYFGGLWWLQHLGSVPAPGRFLADPPARQDGGPAWPAGDRPAGDWRTGGWPAEAAWNSEPGVLPDGGRLR
jgi:Flp pilus assembly protein TadB